MLLITSRGCATATAQAGQVRASAVHLVASAAKLHGYACLRLGEFKGFWGAREVFGGAGAGLGGQGKGLGGAGEGFGGAGEGGLQDCLCAAAGPCQSPSVLGALYCC